jgi:iron complex transport system substrate-binding protein
VKRIVTVAPSLTETIVALGATDRLVGVSRFDEQTEVASVPRVGGFTDPGVETIIALTPDLVVVQKGPGNQKPVEQLAALGIPVLALPLTSVSDVLDAMVDLGHVLGRDEAAAALVAHFQAVRQRIRDAAKARKKTPSVLLVYGFSPLVVAGPGSFAHELLVDCGARNAAEKAPTAYPTYSLERAVKLTPDIIIDAADASAGREEVMKLRPLQKARWVTLTSKDLLHPGPALAKGLEGLNELLLPPR